MASKLIQARKRQLLSELEDKRNAIKAGAVNLQRPVNEGGLAGLQYPAQRNTRLINPKPTSSIQGLGFLSSASVLAEKASSLKKSPYMSKIVEKVKENSSHRLLQTKADTKRSFKPVFVGCGVIFIVGSMLAKTKKSKKHKKALEEEKIAKMGAGFMLLKWLLSTSQPAVKYAITKKVKGSILG